MKKKKILSLALAGMAVLSGGVVLAGCESTENPKTQAEIDQGEQQNVASIEINEASLPNYIIKGKFYRTNITAKVTYEDGSSKDINVTQNMLAEEDKTNLTQKGQYYFDVNYGGQTTSFFMKVVGEEYLLKEVIENNLNKDITTTATQYLNGVITGDYRNSYYDANNKVAKIIENEENEYEEQHIWFNNGLMYDANKNLTFNTTKCEKSLPMSDNEWIKNIQSLYHYTQELITGGEDEWGQTWQKGEITTEGVNYIYTATVVDGGYSETYTYTFNDDFLLKVETSGEGNYSWSTEFDYATMNLQVPTEIKDLEATATVDIDMLEDLVYNYTETDFEMRVDNGVEDVYVSMKYDADNKVKLDTEDGDWWTWINGGYCYHSNGTYASKELYSGNITDFFDSTFPHATGANIETTIDSKIIDNSYYEVTYTTDYGAGEELEVIKYTYDNDKIIKLEISYGDTWNPIAATYRKVDVTLEVPAEIKSLESSAILQQ